ncbi:hypothetical protein [Actinomyces dentalis]|jgi:hypothetical protein|uniref:hypothetical protein n=1 Tax=Actinomyces dentalis TaxID=272548 RepID=UPI0023564291|nr:hypothetical protein [Actinomyces dentalis]
MSHRTHESDPDDIDIADLYNLRGSPSTGPGGSGPSPWPRPSASAVLTLIAWGLAAVLAHFIRTRESFVDLSWSSHDDVGFYVDIVYATTGVEFLLAIIGALTALALVATEPGRGRIGAAIVSIVLAGLALSVFLNNWIVLLFESPVRQEVWWGGLLMGVCPAIVLAASIVELHRSATR